LRGEKQADIEDDWKRDLTERGFLREYFIGDTDFALANGQMGVSSKFDGKAIREGDKIFISGTVTHTWDDTYHFNEKEFKLHDDSSLGLEFHQREYDEAEMLKKYAGAKEFNIKGKWEQKVRGSITIQNGKLVDPWFEWEGVAVWCDFSTI
jgi:hypothetical protein